MAKERGTTTVDREKFAETRALGVGRYRRRAVRAHPPTSATRRPGGVRSKDAYRRGDGARCRVTRLGSPRRRHRRGLSLARGPVSNPAVRRGEIGLAEIDAWRPVVVLTHDPMGRVLHLVIVGPLTSAIGGFSTEVAPFEADDVRRACGVDLDNVQLVSRSRLVRRAVRATPDTLRTICAAAAAAIDCRTS